MSPEFKPAAGAAGWAVSNPPIFSSAPLRASLPLFAAGRHAGAAREVAGADRLPRVAAAAARRRGLDRDHARAHPRSAAVSSSLRVRAGARARPALFDALARSGVVCDWREPDIIRLAPVPLYNGFEDVLARPRQRLRRDPGELTMPRPTYT